MWFHKLIKKEKQKGFMDEWIGRIVNYMWSSWGGIIKLKLVIKREGIYIM